MHVQNKHPISTYIKDAQLVQYKGCILGLQKWAGKARQSGDGGPWQTLGQRESLAESRAQHLVACLETTPYKRRSGADPQKPNRFCYLISSFISNFVNICLDCRIHVHGRPTAPKMWTTRTAILTAVDLMWPTGLCCDPRSTARKTTTRHYQSFVPSKKLWTHYYTDWKI